MALWHTITLLSVDSAFNNPDYAVTRSRNSVFWEFDRFECEGGRGGEELEKLEEKKQVEQP